MNNPGDPHQGYPPGGGYPPQPGYGAPPGYPPHGPRPRKGNTALLVTLIVLVVAAIAGAATLYFTGFFNKQPATTTSQIGMTPAPITPAPAPVPAPAPAPVASGGDVAARLQQVVAQAQAQLPLVNGPTTITALSASGTTLIMEADVDLELSPTDWTAFETGMRSSMCRGNFTAAIQAGASAQIEVTDAGGESRTFLVNSC